MKNKTALLFLILALCALVFGISFGLFASLQYILPNFLKEYIPFNKMRPFHVTSVISWIILCATGSIYFFITKIEKLKLYSPKLSKVHFLLFFITGLGIYLSFILGKTEGREYMAYPPLFTIPIVFGWLLFGINYFKTIVKNVSNWPVYYWMWGTGIVFMMYHLLEAQLWVFPYFREHVIKDITIQWKSYGSFVGSFNMLVYGIAIYLMSKIKTDESIARGKAVFFFYFLGLANLMFGWAHHTYLIPTLPWVRYIAYGASMTEWVLLAHIIYSWSKSLSKQEKQSNTMVYKFLMASEFWVFFNLFFALLISIPAINFFTHGTHLTVAHSMGTTIGINTTILFASLFYIVSQLNLDAIKNQFFEKKIYLLFNVSLFFFLTALFIAGVRKSYWMYYTKEIPFSQMQEGLHFVYIAILIFGIGLFTSIITFSIILLKRLLKGLNYNDSL